MWTTMSWRLSLLLLTLWGSALAYTDRQLRPTVASYSSGGGSDDSCVVSLVIPRDKIKSSCTTDGRMERRLSAAEMKLSIYRQQVAELQGQQVKERQFAHDKLMALEEKLSMMDLLAKYHHDLEKKVEQLESKFQNSGSLAKAAVAGGRSEGSEREAGSSSSSSTSNIRLEHPGAHSNMANAIRPIVASQVQKMFDAFTDEVKELVRYYALNHNKIYDVPRNDGVPQDQRQQGQKQGQQQQRQQQQRQQAAAPEGAAADSWPYESRSTTRSSSASSSSSESVLKGLQDIRGTVNRTGDSLATKVGDFIGNLSGPEVTAEDGGVTEPTQTTRSEHRATYPASTSRQTYQPHTTDHRISDATLEARRVDETSGRLTHKKSNDNARIQAASPYRDVEEGGRDDTAETYSTAADSGRHTPTRPAAAETFSTEDPETNVIHQRPSFWPNLEALLRREISAALTQHMDSVISLVEKQSGELQSVREQQHRSDKILLDKHSMDLRVVEERIEGLRLEMSSFTEALKGLNQRQDKLEAMGETVSELKKNVSAMAAAPAAAEVSDTWTEVVDEHGKKLRTLERLSQIFQQSLQHYRNETKAAYTELHEQMNRETNYVRTVYADMHHNVTTTLSKRTEALNTSLSLRMDRIDERLRSVEDNNVLVQVDVSDLERRLKSKTSKLDNELRSVQGDLEAVQRIQRGLSNTGNELATGQHRLASRLNATEHVLDQLQMEVRISVSSNWVEYNFDYVKSRTQCFGKQYVQMTNYKVGRLVGVVLCNNTRYKILLADSLQDTFKNVGDDTGMGEDHCEFVNAPSRNVRISPPSMSFDHEEGYARDNWGDTPRRAHLNMLRPSPTWYECGVAIP